MESYNFYVFKPICHQFKPNNDYRWSLIIRRIICINKQNQYSSTLMLCMDERTHISKMIIYNCYLIWIGDKWGSFKKNKKCYFLIFSSTFFSMYFTIGKKELSYDACISRFQVYSHHDFLASLDPFFMVSYQVKLNKKCIRCFMS